MSGAAAAAPTSTTARKSCTCNNCHEPFARCELDSHFLCVTCRTIPGVKGYRDPTKRGLEPMGAEGYNSSTYLRDNPLDNLIVRDDEPAAFVPPTPSPDTAESSAFADARPSAPAKQLSEVEKWIEDVFRAPIESDVKVYLLALQRCADYGTAVNIFPGRNAIAAKLNWSTKKVRKVEAQAIKAGWIRTYQRLRNGWRRSSMLYQLLRPDTAPHGTWSGPDQIQNRKGTTTANSLKAH